MRSPRAHATPAQDAGRRLAKARNRPTGPQMEFSRTMGKVRLGPWPVHGRRPPRSRLDSRGRVPKWTVPQGPRAPDRSSKGAPNPDPLMIHPEPEPTSKPKILVVDDCKVMCIRLEKMLQGLGYPVVTAPDAGAALRLLRVNSIAIVTVDVQMPRLSGIDLLRIVKKAVPNILVIMLTAVTRIETAIEAMRLGAFDYVVKPVTSEQLGEHIERASRSLQLRNKSDDMLRGLTESLAERDRELERRREELQHLQRTGRKNLVEGVEVSVNLVRKFDDKLAAHAYRVAAFSSRVAARMGVPLDKLHNLYVAALVHDSGLMCMPEISKKLGDGEPLTPQEEIQCQQHPVIGAGLLEGMARFRSAKMMIRAHHERGDGGGYPDGLAREDIPLGARVIAAVDAYDTHLTEAGERSIDAIVAQSEKAFDPTVVTAFRDFLTEYENNGHRFVDHAVSELHFALAEPGMRLAADLRNDHGMLIVPRGTVLTDETIVKIGNHLDPDDTIIVAEEHPLFALEAANASASPGGEQRKLG